ncbi:hypothetical protein PV327_000019 [Microctonus hyperodae]|uniref:Uncharacterized protein n=1 Tax=Microctonus hyperodae TaxID=165561 RepID=A0AA39G5L9_MICHY|nr:hypothetical protein PV327_000019 [Microctonus hyperodae]
MDSTKWTIIILVLILNKIYTLAYPPNEKIFFPLRYVDHSINLKCCSTKNALLPSGKCEDMRNRDLFLTIPGTSPTNLYPGFIDSYRVSCLTISDSLIEHIAVGAFDFVPNLLYLDISRNRIEFCDLLMFGGHNRLITLIIDDNNKIQSDKTDLVLARADYFPRLEHLYLRNNLLQGIGLSLRQTFPSLTHLYLSDNRLRGQTFDYLEVPLTLTHLHLERNRIHCLNSRQLINLSSLFLDGNRIQSVCWWQCQNSSHLNLYGMSQLQFLSLARNEITHIECDTFEDARYLKSLNFAHNTIEVILPGILDGLQELRDLSLSYNYLKTVPDFRHIRMLTSLSIDHNYLDTISTGTFTDLYYLKWLSLGGNHINSINSDAFVNLPSLEELDLSHNRLSYLATGWIGGGTSLRHLDIRGNSFTNIDSLFLNNVATLTHLYLQGNPLREVVTPARWQLANNLSVYLEYGSSVHRKPCYVSCDQIYMEYSIPRLTLSDEWNW